MDVRLTEEQEHEMTGLVRAIDEKLSLRKPKLQQGNGEVIRDIWKQDVFRKFYKDQLKNSMSCC